MQDRAIPGFPVPRREELSLVAAAAGRRVDGGDGLWPLPMCRVRRRLAGIHVNAIEVAGRDFYDYVAVLDQNDIAKILTTSRESERVSDVDCVIVEQILGADRLSARGVVKKSFYTHKIVAPPGGKLSAVLGGHPSLVRDERAAKRKLGIVTDSIRDEPTIHKLLPSLAQLHVERWGFDGIDSAFLEPARIRQYEAAAGRAMVTRVRAGEEILAIHYGPVFENTLLFHTPVINIAFLDFSPLKILLNAVAESCDQWGIGIIDLGLGDEDYKARYATDSSQISEFFIPLSCKGHALARIWSRDTAPWRRRYDDLLHSLRAARSSVRRRLNRVRFFHSAATDALPATVDGYREVATWRELISLLRQSGIPPKRYQYERIRGGQRFLCLLQGAEIICYGWLWMKDEPFVVGETGESLPAGTQVLFDFVTPERHRNRGCYTRLLKAIAAARPGGSLCIFALTGNAASIAGIQRAGYVEYSR